MNIIIKKSDKPDKKYTAIIDNKKNSSFWRNKRKWETIF